MDFKSILLAQKTGYIPRNHFDALFARRMGGAVLKDFPGLPASIVTVTDALAKPLDSLKVAITPVQSGSGDPSPDNIRPISGWTECNVWRTGKNLLNPTPYIENADIGSNNKIVISNSYGIYVVPMVEGASYTIKNRTNQGYPAVGVMNDTPAVGASVRKLTDLRNIGKYSYTNTNGYKYLVISYGMNAMAAHKSEIWVELGTTATTYEPYTGQDYPITFPSEAGTVYGGTLDVTNGTLTVTHESTIITDQTYKSQNGNNTIYIAQDEKYIVSQTPICSAFNGMPPQSSTRLDMFECAFNNQLSGINFKFDVDTTVADWDAVLVNNPVQLVLQLATPITYQLTPTEVQMLLGTNNIWADTGDILEGKYWGKKSSVTRAMLNTLQGAREITEITPEEPEESDER